MVSTPLRLLIIEDSEDDARILLHELEKGDYEVQCERVETAAALTRALEHSEFDLVIADYVIPGFGGLQALKIIRDRAIDLPFFMTSGVIGEETAVEVMKAGAGDFIVKGNYSRLVPAITRELHDYRVRKEQEREVATQRHEVEKQRQLAFTMIKQNPQPLILMKKNFDIKLVNDAFIVLSGYREQELLTMNAHNFKVLEKSRHGIREALETKKGVTGDVKVEFPSGIHYLEQHTIPLLDTDNEIISIMIVYNDLTEKREKDAALQAQMESVARLQKQAETMIRENPLAIAVLREDKSRVDINKEYENLWQSTRENLLQKKLYDFDIRVTGGDEFYASFETKKKAVSELEVTFKDGKRKFLTLYQVPVLDSAGNIEVNYYIYLDLTPQVELARYRDAFIRTLVGNMKKLANGDFQLDLTIEPAGIFTRDAHDQFGEINRNIGMTRDALGALIQDTQAITDAVVQGRLNARAAPGRHQGDYAKVIAGVNNVMESVAVPVNESLRVCQEYAKTNFTARFNPRIEVAGDWVEFREALNNIGVSVSQAVTLVNKQVLDLAAAAEEANASVEEVTSGSAQITKNIASVSKNSEKGREGVHQVLKAMEDLTTTVGDVSIKAEAVSKLAGESNSLSRKGEDLAKKAESGMAGITRNTEEVHLIVSDIKSQMDQIGKIVGVITDLANQTNLLALNAAIEAARAGDAGRGFAVVATEVKSLAQESRTSAQNIAEMINTLQQKTLRAAESVNETTRTVQEGSSALSETLQVFANIAESIGRINRNMEEVAGASEEQAASVQEITASITEVDSLINNTASEAQQSAEGSEQAAMAISQVAGIIGNVNQISEKVSGEMSKFRV